MKFTCTFTGIDSNIINNHIPDIFELSKKYPFIEWGVLFSFSRAGQDLKYPTAEEIEYFGEVLYDRGYTDSDSHVQRSLHLCGSAARKFLTLESVNDSIMIHNVVRLFDRTQININANNSSFDVKPTVLRQLAIWAKPIILQYNDNNRTLIESFGISNYPDIHILKDASGGNGIFSSDVTIPLVCKYSSIGFAGGFGSENIEEIFPKIYESIMSNNIEGQFENPGFSIDMETKVRNAANQFDLEKVNKVAEFLAEYLKDKSIEF